MCDQLKSLSEDQLKKLIKQAVDRYHNEDYIYSVSNISTRDVNAKGRKISFHVEIGCRNGENH